MTTSAAINFEGLASNYRAGEIIAAHAHEAHQIVHAVSGVMRVLARGGTWVVPPGRGLWVPARTVHEVRCIGFVQMRTVYLYGDHPAFPTAVRVTSVSALMREIMVRLAEGAEPHQLPHFGSLLVDEIAALDLEPLHLPTPEDERIARLTSALQLDPGDSTSLRCWADRFGMSRRTLMRRIRGETGMSFRQLRRQARVMAALERLAQGESVTGVAFDVGFESPSAFIQAFRSVIGTTPGRYMK